MQTVPLPPRHFVNLRVGASPTDGNARPTLCLETSPLPMLQPLAFEACGTGSGLLHNDPGGELAHFRAKWRVKNWRVQRHWLVLAPSAGFAELETGVDRPGFRVNPDRAAGGTAAGGPEASLSLAWFVSLGGDFEWLVDANAGMAYIPGAPRLQAPGNRAQPFATLSLGVGW